MGSLNGRIFRKPISSISGACLLLLACLMVASLGGKPYSLGGKALSGYAYVLDSENLNGRSKVFMIDTATSHVVKTIEADYAPDMALSPDGSRLYVASSTNEAGKLDIYDTESGQLVRTVENPQRSLPTLAWYHSHMVFSPNGKWLFIYKYDKRFQRTDPYSYYVDIFDAGELKFTGWRMPLPKCFAGLMTPSADSRRLTVMCTFTNDLRFFEISERGEPRQISSLPLRPRGRNNRDGFDISLASLVPSASGAKALMSDGSLFDIDPDSRAIKGLSVVDGAVRRIGPYKSPSLTADENDWMGGRWLPFRASAVAGDKTYLGIGQLADKRHSDLTFNTIGVFDSDTLNRRATIETKHRLYSFVINRDGSRLFGVDPVNKSLVVFDTKRREEVAVIDNLGVSPTQVLVGP
jgi:Methylamine dehydrogenase heavy chain (MADH)/WD40-like Beta Propeller Repeat